MNMNGGASTSATDPHHRSSGYLGMGLPGLGVTPMTPPSGNGFAGPSLSGLGMSGGAVGPELKHHADFLSRLLAATPSYPSDVGNPPPGFFSDWLRRLVSKPGPGNGSSPPHAHHNSHRTGRGSGSPSAPTSIQQQTSSLTFSPTGGQAESNGAGPLESSAQHQGTSGGSSSVPKRRKRTRITDHHLHLTHQQHMTTTGKDPNSVGESPSPSPLTAHLNHNQNSLVSSALTSTLSGSSSSSAAAAAAAASLNPFTHPLWFFPPFLPNPYLNPMNMNMGMSIPGLIPPHGVPPGSTPPYMGSNLGGSGTSESLLSSYRNSGDNILHAHHHHRQFNAPTDMNLNLMKKEGNSVEPKSANKRSANGKGKKSSSFSISRLTSPSPSSNSSGGSLTSKGSNNNNNNTYSFHQSSSGMSSMGESKATTSLASGSDSGRNVGKGGRDRANSDSSDPGPSGGQPNCVDLRVSGRSWEKSGVSAPPPRSIYKPLSAFHDPAEVNLPHSSRQRSSPDNSGRQTTKTGSEQQEERMISGDQSNLSTTYVLKNLQHIYRRVKERVAGSSTDSVTNSSTINNTSSNFYKTHRPHSNSTSLPSLRKGNHTFNYSDSDESNNESNQAGSSFSPDPDERKKIIDLVEASASSATPSRRSGGEKKSEPEIKIPLPRPIKAEPNYSSGGSKRGHDLSNSNLSFDDDEDEEPLELRPTKAYKYGPSTISTVKSSSIPSENEEDEDGGSDDIVNILSDETENEDEGRR